MEKLWLEGSKEICKALDWSEGKLRKKRQQGFPCANVDGRLCVYMPDANEWQQQRIQKKLLHQSS